jgi:hypothetical protein
MLAVALALFSAAEATDGISEPSIRSPGGSMLSVPIGSPVQFASFGQHETAKFKGSFELQGMYHYGYLTMTRTRIPLMAYWNSLSIPICRTWQS